VAVLRVEENGGGALQGPIARSAVRRRIAARLSAVVGHQPTLEGIVPRHRQFPNHVVLDDRFRV